MRYLACLMLLLLPAATRLDRPTREAGACQHLDLLGTYLFSPTQYGVARRITDPYNAGVAASIENDENSRKKLIGIDGRVEFSAQEPTPRRLRSVELYGVHEDSHWKVPGAKIKQTGNAFTIRGLSLDPGSSYLLAARFDEAPTEVVKLPLEAVFQDG